MSVWTVTVLRTVAGRCATKRWIWRAALNEWSRISYTAGAWFHPAEIPVTSLRDLAAVLEPISKDPRALIVRGALADRARDALARDPGHLIRRRKLKRGEIEPDLIEVSCPWAMIDVDGFPLRGSDDLADDPESAIEYAIGELLPPAFHDAECWWQLSSSAGFVDGVLKCHLAFWLTEPVSNPHIKAVFKQQIPGIDPVLFDAVQIHYIAAPIIEGGHDPLPRRTGWRKGSDAAVTLPQLRQEPPQQRASTGGGGAAGTVQHALKLLGDGHGLQGFHAPLRRATLLYAKHNSTRDDVPFIKALKAAIRAAPRRADRSSVDEYLSDHYLQRLIDGASAILAGNPDIQSMRPRHALATATAEVARLWMADVLREFLTRCWQWHRHTWEWHLDHPNAQPEQAALVAALGLGKSTHARDRLPAFIVRQRSTALPHRALWTVPTHKLGREALGRMDDSLSVAIWRGRDAIDPVSHKAMCAAPEAVKDALTIGEDVEQSVCGNPDGDACCPFYRTCGYQRQKTEVATADVVIAAHNILFGSIPKIISENLALVVTDEAWWQIGLEPERETKLPTFASCLFTHQVLRDPDVRRGFDGKTRRRPKRMPRRQTADEAATSELHELAVKAQRAFEATPQGAMVARADVVAAGLTAADCAAAAKLEWRRKRLHVLRPGMSPDARKAAVALAAVNVTLPRRAGIWRALEALLAGIETHSGRLEIATKDDAGGSCPVVLLHSRREISDTITALPILCLDATMPTDIVRHFLPRLTVLADVQAAAPHLAAFQFGGGWGKTSLIPHDRAQADENARRGGLLAELRDFVGLHGGGNALVITYDAIESRFAQHGVRTGHFNAIAGLDTFGDARTVFVIGRPLPAPDVHRRLALALAGRPIAPEEPHLETRGQLMADGSGMAVECRVYADPDMEALRVAITDTEVLQAAGRGRAVNRTAKTPLALFILADVLVPLPVKQIHRWADVRPNVLQRMAARGLVTDSGTDAARLYPDLFPSAGAARLAFHRGSSVTSPYDSIFLGECNAASPLPGTYRPKGNAQHTRRMVVAAWRAPTVKADLEAALGPLAHFELAPAPGAEAQPAVPEPPVAMSLADFVAVADVPTNAGLFTVMQPPGRPPIEIEVTPVAMENGGGSVTKIAIFQ